MPLIDLKSDLTSCKYGHDRPGGSDSGQPFIISYSSGDIEVNTSARNPLALVGVSSIPAIPNFTTLLGRKKIGQFILDAVNGDDFIRGGGAGSLQASINDVFRISAFLASLPKGPIFLAKQIGLQLSNPILERRKGNFPLTGVGAFASRLTGGILQPTRIYNLGINTLAQVGANAFGGHFIRHGLSPFQDSGDPNFSYEKIAIHNNNLGDYDNPEWRNIGNRLSSLQEKLNVGVEVQNNVRYYQDQINALNVIDVTSAKLTKEERASAFASTLQDIFIGGKKRKKLFPKDVDFIKIDVIGGPGSTYGIGPTIIRRYDYTDVTKNIKDSFLRSNLYAGKSQDKDQIPVNWYENSLSTYNRPADYINGYKEIITLKVGNFKENFREERVSSGRTDGINTIPIFESDKNIEGEVVIGGKLYNLTDLVNFQIKAIDGTTPSLSKYMVFRAYLTQFSDSTDATWNNTKYAGRGEDFYIYNGFSRKIQIGFKVAALSAQEMKPMYQKLNYLMSNLMPDYGGILMRGPLVKMTVGNWLYNQEGILNSLTYTIPNESPWEIAISNVDGVTPLVLPHIVEVQITFTPIGTKDRGNNYTPQKYQGNSNIAQTRDNESNTTQYITGSIYSTSNPKEVLSDPAGIRAFFKDAQIKSTPPASLSNTSISRKLNWNTDKLQMD